MRARTTVRVFGAAFGMSLLVVLACRIPPPWGPTNCRPSKPDCPNDGKDYRCCSDDPLAIDLFDLAGPGLPAYEGRGGTATPVFSEARNDASDSGMCIEIGSVAPAFALTNGCPVPCNPTWDKPSVEAVCGADVSCCQTVELEASDCVLDPNLGDDGCWRPVRGDDISGLGGLDATNWSAAEHATLQDPGFAGCESFVEGLPEADLDAAGVTADDVRLACIRRLSVANQRGYCIGGPGVIGCPLAQPTYRDACEQLNDAEFRPGCS